MLQEMDRPLGLEALERLPRVFPTKEEALPLLVELRGMAAVSCLPPEERWFVPCPVFPTDQAYLRDEAGERYRVVPGCEWVCRGIGAGRWEPVVAPGVAEEIRIGQGIWRLGTPSWHGEEHISILRPPQPLRANRDTWRPGTTLASFLNDVFGLEKPKENGT